MAEAISKVIFARNVDWRILFTDPGFLPSSLVHIDSTDLPIGFFQLFWFAPDPIIASFEGLGLVFAVELEAVSTNTATECCVEN